ncbi:MAG: hypothetical protein M3490_11380, partial [Chloroflexota bacterium]|nr:hypothetical protein [Chloroflexota bacterium]
TMSHSGLSSCPDDSRLDPETPEAGCQSGQVIGARHDAVCGVYHHDCHTPNEDDGCLPIQAARADAATRKESLPFVVQAGQIMYLVVEERDAWVLAELRFDSASCTFAEERRTGFQWPREVFGRLLSRTIVGDHIDMDEANRVADAFTRWLASHYVIAQSAR